MTRGKGDWKSWHLKYLDSQERLELAVEFFRDYFQMPDGQFRAKWKLPTTTWEWQKKNILEKLTKIYEGEK